MDEKLEQKGWIVGEVLYIGIRELENGQMGFQRIGEKAGKG